MLACTPQVQVVTSVGSIEILLYHERDGGIRKEKRAFR